MYGILTAVSASNHLSQDQWGHGYNDDGSVRYASTLFDSELRPNWMTSTYLQQRTRPGMADLNNQDRQAARDLLNTSDDPNKPNINKNTWKRAINDEPAKDGWDPTTPEAVAARTLTAAQSKERKRRESFDGSNLWLDKASGDIRTIGEEVTLNGVQAPITVQPMHPADVGRTDSYDYRLYGGSHRVESAAVGRPGELLPVRHHTPGNSPPSPDEDMPGGQVVLHSGKDPNDRPGVAKGVLPAIAADPRADAWRKTHLGSP